MTTLFQRLFSYQDSISRSQWWRAMAILAITNLALIVPGNAAVKTNLLSLAGFDGLLLVILVWSVWTNLVVGAKRWSALGYSPWRSLLALVPFVNIDVFYIYGFSVRSARLGADESSTPR